MKSTPLPTDLSGEVQERLIRIDKSLLPYIAGALEWLTDKEPFDETGTLTVETARELLSEMLWDFYHEDAMTAVIGEYKMLAHEIVPAGWLQCRGAVVAQSAYPKLYAVIGGTYDTGGEGVGNFRLPDFSHRSPMGAPYPEYVGARGGSLTQTLSVLNLPPHTHQQSNNVPLPANRHTGVAGANPSMAFTNGTTNSADALRTQSTGSGEPFSIIHPVLYGNIIIYAGE